SEPFGCSTRCQGAARDVCGVVVGLWRHTHAPEARGDDPEPDLAVRGGEAGQRALHGIVLPLLRAGDSQPALLQYFWAAAGSDVAVLRSTGEVHHADAAWRAADDLWRRRAEPGLYLHRQRSEREPAGGKGAFGKSSWTHV